VLAKVDAHTASAASFRCCCTNGNSKCQVPNSERAPHARQSLRWQSKSEYHKRRAHSWSPGPYHEGSITNLNPLQYHLPEQPKVSSPPPSDSLKCAPSASPPPSFRKTQNSAELHSRGRAPKQPLIHCYSSNPRAVDPSLPSSRNLPRPKLHPLLEPDDAATLATLQVPAIRIPRRRHSFA
jgi:hypothetical protein